VVDETRIRNLGAQTLEDVLRTLPDIDIVTDELGRNRIVFRGLPDFVGGSSSAVLVLLNGHRLNEAINGGATAINLDIPVEAVKRVEILRGPGSALYGSGALTGVINVVTYGPDDVKGIEISGGLGSFGHRDVTLRTGSVLKQVRLGGFIHFVDRGGSGLTVPADVQTLVDRSHPDLAPISLAPGKVSDDHRTLETVYRVSYKGLDLDWRVKQERSGGFIGPTGSLGKQNDLNNRQMLLDAGWSGSLPGKGTLHARLGWTRNQIRRLLELFPPDYETTMDGNRAILPSGVLLQTSLDSDRVEGEGRVEYSLPGGHQLVAGVSLDREATSDLSARGNLDLATQTPFNGLVPLPGVLHDASRTTLAGYAEDAFRLSRPQVEVTAGVRVDHLSDVGTSVSPRIAGVWTLPGSLTLKTLYGRSFRAPSFTELDFDLPGLIGNPDLKPTTADTLEADLAYKGEQLELRGGAYLSFVRDPIVPEGPVSVLEPSRLRNGPDIDLKGVSFEAQRDIGPHTAFASFALQSPKDKQTGARVAGVPSLMATVGATLLLRDRFSLTPTLTLRSSRARDPADARKEIGGYGVLNLGFRGRDILPKLDVGVTIQDILNTRYSDPSPLGGVPGDYPRPGRTLLVHGTYRF
jgi:outer membrane receptor protein involved in Fe transport